jgi:hypothetical protein
LKIAPTKSKVTPQIQVSVKTVPDTERCLRALMLVLGVGREEIEHLLKERRERLDHHEGAVH